MFSQTVRSFNMQHRLLLTGTPLQVTDCWICCDYVLLCDSG